MGLLHIVSAIACIVGGALTMNNIYEATEPPKQKSDDEWDEYIKEREKKREERIAKIQNLNELIDGIMYNKITFDTDELKDSVLDTLRSIRASVYKDNFFEN